MGKEAKQINPLIFIKIFLPFAFPLVGFLLPPLFPISTPSETDSYCDLIQEEEVEDQHKMDSLVLASQTEFVIQNVVRIEQGEEELSLREEIERLNGRVSNVEESENQMKLEFSEYCNMKNYESLVEKLQIMCLGLKTEYLEEHNQRLEESIAKLIEEKEKFEAMSDEIKRLKRNFEKVSNRNEQNLLMVHQKMQDYEAREAELLRRNHELEMTIRDVKEMIQIQEKCTSKVKIISLLCYFYCLNLFFHWYSN